MVFSLGQKGTDKKNPSTWAGVVSLFAVTHQGPAQGGKAGGSKLPGAESNKLCPQTQVFLSNAPVYVSAIWEMAADVARFSAPKSAQNPPKTSRSEDCMQV
jgi:hypothetical protein